MSTLTDNAVNNSKIHIVSQIFLIYSVVIQWYCHLNLKNPVIWSRNSCSSIW